MATTSRESRTWAVAEEVARLLEQHGAACALIGAVAAAVHGYPRATRDLDLATDTDPFGKLREIGSELSRAGYRVHAEMPDAQDPLGGVLHVEGDDFERIEIGGSELGGEAVRAAVPLEGTTLKVVPLPYLIALKLYAGGSKNTTDVLELVERNPELDLGATAALCARYRLGEPLEAILKSLGQ